MKQIEQKLDRTGTPLEETGGTGLATSQMKNYKKLLDSQLKRTTTAPRTTRRRRRR
jgi:hypothetical protein